MRDMVFSFFFFCFLSVFFFVSMMPTGNAGVPTERKVAEREKNARPPNRRPTERRETDRKKEGTRREKLSGPGRAAIDNNKSPEDREKRRGNQAAGELAR
jgi:hypothetical protein